MEPEVQEASQVPRSELDTAFYVCRAARWLVVPFVQTTTWGYVLRAESGDYTFLLPPALVLSEDRQRDLRSATSEGEE